MMADARQQGEMMLRKAGLRNVTSYEQKHVPGDAIHEMGGARMGADPRASLLHNWNQAQAAANLFLTDGWQMNSNSFVNPSPTFMAITYRAENGRAACKGRAGATN